MWLYIIGGIIVLIVVAAYFFIRRGLNRIKPDPLKGSSSRFILWYRWTAGNIIILTPISLLTTLLLTDIPLPPLSHPLLGHPDKMIHPLKHELRLAVCDAARTPVHQVRDHLAGIF
jgi:hypothetical protein